MRLSESFVSSQQIGPSVTGEELGGVAVFFDTENILLGIQGEFEVDKVVGVLAERGDVMVLRAYADWGRYRKQQRQFLEAGVQMVFLPSYGVSDKNRTDTAICVDAMEALFTRPHIDTFCIVSGDSDFGVLAGRLRDYGKRIIGISAKKAASNILVKQCHEFIFYETLVGQRVQGSSVEEGEARLQKALENVVEEYGQEFRASILKDRMRKLDPTFSERNYGAASFTKFLRSYEHLLTVRDGGLVRVGRARDDDDGDGDSNSGNRRSRPRGPRLNDADAARARDVLKRTILAAVEVQTPVRLSRLKDFMLSIAPDFDELALGYKTFTRFLLAFPDIIALDRAENTAMPAPGLAEEAAPPKKKASKKRGTKKKE